MRNAISVIAILRATANRANIHRDQRMPESFAAGCGKLIQDVDLWLPSGAITAAITLRCCVAIMSCDYEQGSIRQIKVSRSVITPDSY